MYEEMENAFRSRLEQAMSQQPLGKSNFQNIRRSGLTKEETFCLWLAATKDDPGFTNAVIEKIYKDMINFDRERAENVIELMVRWNADARYLFQDLLRDMHNLSGSNPPPPRVSLPAQRGS